MFWFLQQNKKYTNILYMSASRPYTVSTEAQKGHNKLQYERLKFHNLWNRLPFDFWASDGHMVKCLGLAVLPS